MSLYPSYPVVREAHLNDATLYVEQHHAFRGRCLFCPWRGPLRDHPSDSDEDLNEHRGTAEHRDSVLSKVITDEERKLMERYL